MKLTEEQRTAAVSVGREARTRGESAEEAIAEHFLVLGMGQAPEQGGGVAAADAPASGSAEAEELREGIRKIASDVDEYNWLKRDEAMVKVLVRKLAKLGKG